MRANADHYVLGGSYDTSVDADGTFLVKMKLAVKLNKASDFGHYKCIAKNALGNSEETITILGEFKPSRQDHIADLLRRF